MKFNLRPKLLRWLLSLLVVALLGTQIAGEFHALETEFHDASCSLLHSASDIQLPPLSQGYLRVEPVADLTVAPTVRLGTFKLLDNYAIRAPPHIA